MSGVAVGTVGSKDKKESDWGRGGYPRMRAKKTKLGAVFPEQAKRTKRKASKKKKRPEWEKREKAL